MPALLRTFSSTRNPHKMTQVASDKRDILNSHRHFTTTSRLTKRNPFDKKKESAITAKRVGECRRYHLKVRGENQPKNHHLFV